VLEIKLKSDLLTILILIIMAILGASTLVIVG
jgi:hypothetical protein